MTKEEIINRLYDRYIRPTEHKKDSFVGVEIEMPIVNLEGKAVDFEIVHMLTSAFLKEFGFIPTGIDEQGNIYAALNRQRQKPEVCCGHRFYGCLQPVWCRHRGSRGWRALYPYRYGYQS